MLLVDARQVARQVFQGHDGNPETVAEADETGGLVRRVAIEHPGQHQRLVGDETDRLPVDTAETDHDVGGEQFHHFQKIAVVHQGPDHVSHVIGNRGIVGNDLGDVVAGFGIGRLGLGGRNVVRGRNQ